MALPSPSTSTSPVPPVGKAFKPLSRVIVADDEHLVAIGLVAHLSALGIEAVAVCRTGAEAVRAAEEANPQLALLDIRMPDLDGLECAAVLWSRHRIPSVIISAYSGDQYLTQATETGVFGYLLKPVEGDALRVALLVAWARACNLIETSERVEQLEETLAARRVVEHAKWRLVSERGISEPDAHAILQKAARNSRKRIAEVAQGFLSGGPLD
ncbi:MAG TPA: hypothetical protein DEB06_04275 [Phycisphaerales bacterium]|nr:hypothetical protein [Phycisphaerales bacterium]